MTFSRHITVLLACFMFATSIQAVQIRREPGHRIPENILPTDRDNPALWTPERSYIYTRGAAPGDYAINDIPRTDTIHYPLVLVQFPDLKFTVDDTDALLSYYRNLFNEDGYNDTEGFNFRGVRYYRSTASVSNYFRDQSYGQYIPRFDIIGPITVSKGYAYYGEGDDDNVQELVLEICDSIITHNLASLSGYARNGIIDQLSLVYAGRGENYYGSDPNTIWPHANLIPIVRRDSTIYQSGIRRIKYCCSCELFWDTDSIPDGIGTFCHEFSHTLGLPDFYNTDYSDSDKSQKDDEDNAAMGFWSLMDYGCYDNQGFSPVGYTAFEKYSLGWLDLEEITYQGSYDLNVISQRPDPEAGIHSAYRLNTGNDNQFIILENHAKSGWYSQHKAEGLMVTAVDYNKSGWTGNYVNNYNPKHYRILPADNDYKRNTNAGDLFPYTYTDSEGTHVVDSITTKGEPELKAGTSYPTFSIYNITRNGNLITFKAGYDMPSGIGNVKPDETTVTVYDISGKPVLKTTTSDPEHISLPGPGIWIIKYGNKTRKVRL